MTVAAAPNKELTMPYLIQNSENIQKVINLLKITTKPSITGITNFIVNHESPHLIDLILKECFAKEILFNGATQFDAVELQQGRPGKGISVSYFDELIYGTYKKIQRKNGDEEYDIDPQDGSIRRDPNGLTNRKSNPNEQRLDKLVIMRNVDYCADFCKTDEVGVVDTRALFIFDKFRHNNIKNGCCIVVVTNKPLKLPFNVNVVEMPAVDTYEASHIVGGYTKLLEKKGISVQIDDLQLEQIKRKFQGMTYSSACDCMANSSFLSVDNNNIINGGVLVKRLIKKVNTDLLSGAFGLTQLHPRPWEDYICPEQSSFTHDVKKLMRDFKEIKKLTEENKEKNKESIEKSIFSLRARMPHVIVLYGQGGVGKSAMPVHLAGLLGLDVWDFNVNATHSMYVGQGSEQMRESLKKITKSSHVIIRIDEYDRAIGSSDSKGQGMHEAHKQIESEFMNWLQNSQEENLFVKRNIFVVMTTNHVENITGPLLRSGRVDLVIDVGSFDTNSMQEAMGTCARRMKNREASVLGFDTFDDLQKEINKLDIPRLSEIMVIKKFTVRDLETLIIEMAAHRYYFYKYGDGIPWDTKSFVKVLENSEGSIKGKTTGELKLGDRDFYKNLEDPDVIMKDEDTESFEDLGDFVEK